MAENQERPLKTFGFSDFKDSVDANGNNVNLYDNQNDFSPAEVKKIVDKEFDEQKNSAEVLANEHAINVLMEELTPDVNNAPTPSPTPERKNEILLKIAELKRKNLELMSQVKLQKKLFEDNPELYSRLYGIKGAADKKEGVSAAMGKGDNDELCLVVKMLQPSPFAFAIRDGKITFSNYDVSSDQLKEMLSFMEMNGIKNVEFPDGLDERLKSNMQKAQEELRSEADQNYQRDSNPNLVNGDGPILPGVNPEYPEASTASLASPEPAPEFKYDYKEFKHKLEFDILQRNMGKVKDSSFFHVKKGGWDKWYAYDNQNPDNYDNDGKRAKDNSVTVKNQFVIWSKENKDGTISLGYSMPNGKEVSKALADKLITLHKDRGYTHIKFNDLNDDDAGIFRVRCARLGVIPIGVGINEKHAAEMVSEAGKKLSDDEFQTFKYKLAKQMRANIRNNGGDFDKDRAAGYIKDLEGDYNFNPFKDAYDDHLKLLLDRESKTKKADQAIGAANALYKVFEAYRGGEIDDPSRTTMEYILDTKNNFFSEDQVAAIRAKFAANGKTIDPEQTMRKLSKDDLKAIYEAIMPSEQKAAGLELQEATRGLNQKDAGEVIGDYADSASRNLSDISERLQNKGVKKMYIPPLNKQMKLNAAYDSTNKKDSGKDNQSSNNSNHQNDGR